MFGLEGSGFIVAVAVTLLLSGAIVYYCNTRLTSMEKAIVKQNQVLADFIGNVKLQLTNGPQTGSSNVSYNNSQQTANGATPEAVQGAMDYYSNTTPEDKIPVSEDSDSQIDSDSEEEDDTDFSSTEGDDNDEVNEVVDLSQDNSIEVIGITNELPTVEKEALHTTLSEEPVEAIVEEINVDAVSADTMSPSEIKTINLGDIKNEEELDIATQASSELSSVASNSVSHSHSNSVAETNDDDGSTVNSMTLATVTAEMVKKMKVKQLRQLAVQMELGTEEGVNKIKKTVLQDMIKNKVKDTEE